MTYPPLKCENCGGSGEVDYDRVSDERNEAVCVECPDCNGTGIEPDDEDEDDGLLDEGRM